MRVAISACLLGKPVRYDGGAKPCPAVLRFVELAGVEVVPVCPETAAALPVPRPPAEQRDGGVFLADGTDVTQAFERGSAASARRALEAGVELAILKAKSPSCGVGQIYDGTYSGTLVAGWGTFAGLLRDAGVAVCTEQDVEAALHGGEGEEAGGAANNAAVLLVRQAAGLL